MELDIKTNITNNLVVFNNYEFVKSQINNFIKKYENIIVSEETLKDSTKDRAYLNKISKTLNDRRIDIEKQFKEQFEPFKKQVDSLIEPIKKASENIDIQIKKFEEIEKENKKTSIFDYFNSKIGDLRDLIGFGDIFNEKWLNKSFTIKNIEELIDGILRKINQDLLVIDSLKTNKENILKDFYLKSKFDLSATLQEKTRLEEREKALKELEEKKAKEKQEQMQKLAEEFNNKPIEERYNQPQQQAKQEEDKLEILDKAIEKKQEEQQQQKLYKCSFEVVDTKEKLQLLKEFLINNNINYKRI